MLRVISVRSKNFYLKTVIYLYLLNYLKYVLLLFYDGKKRVQV